MLTIPYNIMTLCVFLSTVSFAAVPLPERYNTDGAVCAGYKAVFTEPPKNCPSDTAVDAPLLGNGYMGVCIGGGPEKPTFWLAMNDFWRLKSQYGESQPRVFGNIEFEFPALKGAAYKVWQFLDKGETLCTFANGNCTLKISAWVAATENVMILHLSPGRVPLQAKMRLNVGQGGKTGTDWMTRSFTEDVDIPVEAACAIKLSGANGLEFKVTDTPIVIVVAMASSFKHDDPLREAQSLATTGSDTLKELWKDHCCWWSEYWAASSVEIDDPDIMRHYYLSNYVMACCSRNPDFPPSIFGTWITTDTPAWQGDYHLNYNHIAPYYGLYSSNHIETAAPYEAPILAFMDRGKWYAKEVHQCRGVLYPVGIGPMGIETTRNSPYKDPHQKCGGLFYGQKSNAAYAVVNMAMRWRLTYDLDYARFVYPFVREVVNFWEDALTFEGGRYVIHGDSVHEGSGKDFNSVVSLGLVRNAVETALDMSTELALDVERREKWQHILDHLSEYATQERDGKTVFRYTEKGTDWWGDNTLGIQHIYPAGTIGLDSDSTLLEIARNTIEVMNRWIDNNGMNSFFPAAVRVGYDPEIILKHLRRYVTRYANTNGFAKDNPHGIENCSIVPNTINEMLCMGHRGVIRVFPVWPRDRDAKFHQLRTWGAFLVSSELKDGEVPYVQLLSERGRDCVVQNPWPGQEVRIARDGQETGILKGERLQFSTKEGEYILLVPVK